MKKALVIIGIVIAVLLVLVLAKDQIIKMAVVKGTESVTGAPAKIGSFSFSLVGKKTVRMKDFRLYNPAGFPEGLLLHVPEISVEYDLPALMKKRIHLPVVVFNLKEVGIVKNKKGELNVDSLKVAQKGKPAKPAKKEEPAESMPMQIDRLSLNIGQVVYKDYTDGEIPTVLVYDIGVKKEYENITSGEQLAALILMESLKPTAIKTAALYGAYQVLAVGALPLAGAKVVSKFVKSASREEVFDVGLDKAYRTALQTLKKIGEVTGEDKGKGEIKAKVKDHSVTVKLEKVSGNKTKITASARKYLAAKPNFAGGIIYQISENF